MGKGFVRIVPHWLLTVTAAWNTVDSVTKKTTCKKCPVHCYSPDMREKIRAVMRYSGPRMIFLHPFAAIRHLAR